MEASLTPSILDLADQIQRETKTIHDHLQQNSLPPLSFAEDAFPFFPGTGPQSADPFPAPDQHIANARRDLLQACETLTQLVTTPADHLIVNLSWSHHTNACVQYITHFHIADAVPVGGEISFAEIAQKAGVDEGRCTRIMRMIMTHGIFHEPRLGYVSHTAGSKLLLIPNIRDSIGHITEEGFVGSCRLSAAVEKFGASEERNAAPWNVGHGVDQPLFDFYEIEPVRRNRFSRMVGGFGDFLTYNIKHMVNGYDWKGLGKGTVVDVGGNTGHCCFAIAAVAPELRFIVQDLEKVIEDVKDRHTDRVDFQVHNFFDPQPVKGADVYLLRYICHDYSDKYAAKILANIVTAMGPRSRIIVIDGIIPAPNTVSKLEERRAR